MANSQNKKESIITKIINLFRNIISPKDKLLELKSYLVFTPLMKGKLSLMETLHLFCH